MGRQLREPDALPGFHREGHSSGLRRRLYHHLQALHARPYRARLELVSVVVDSRYTDFGDSPNAVELRLLDGNVLTCVDKVLEPM